MDINAIINSFEQRFAEIGRYRVEIPPYTFTYMAWDEYDEVKVEIAGKLLLHLIDNESLIGTADQARIYLNIMQ